jgi:hypothetical protein
MIDKRTVNLYGCCKCGYQWTNWSDAEKKDGPLPKYCPKCKNPRWNQRYTEQEIKLYDEILKQHVINAFDKILDTIWCDLDFIAYDFLMHVSPQPDMFELKQVLAIPLSNIEARHEIMISIILDRIRNKEKYEKEYFLKYSKYSEARRKRNPVEARYLPRRKNKEKILLRMEGCNHEEIPEIRDAFYDERGQSKDYDWFRTYNKQSDYWIDGLSKTEREKIKMEREERERLLLSTPFEELGPTQQRIRRQLEEELGIKESVTKGNE